MQLNRQQQQEFAEKMNKELDRIIMSWDNVLKEWYPIAIAALKFASALSLNVPQNKFIELFKTEAQGLNMNIVTALCNNVEGRTPAEMEVDPRKWAEILLINHEVAKQWHALANPIQQRLLREYEIMNGKSGGLKIIKAEA